MKKPAILVAIIAAIAVMTGKPLLAADMAVKAPPPLAVAAPAVNWTGFYSGGNTGGVIDRASGTSIFSDTENGNVFPLSDSFSNTAFLGGLQVGYNWQIDPHWVAGLEADWDWTNAGYSFCRQNDQTSENVCAEPVNVTGFQEVSSRTDWLATVRGRLGMTWGSWLLYGTGGAAFGRVQTGLTMDCLADGCGESIRTLLASSTTNTTKGGWVAGLGAEEMLSANWSVRAEWLHIDLGTINAALPTTGNAGVETAIWSRNERFDELRIGLNYRLQP
jgi:outer membrane immunogenic protein